MSFMVNRPVSELVNSIDYPSLSSGKPGAFNSDLILYKSINNCQFYRFRMGSVSSKPAGSGHECFSSQEKPIFEFLNSISPFI